MEDREQERVMPSPLLTTAIMLLSTNQPPSPSSLYNLELSILSFFYTICRCHCVSYFSIHFLSFDKLNLVM